jgi:hypothetical protein
MLELEDITLIGSTRADVQVGAVHPDPSEG